MPCPGDGQENERIRYVGKGKGAFAVTVKRPPSRRVKAFLKLGKGGRVEEWGREGSLNPDMKKSKKTHSGRREAKEKRIRTKRS